MAFVPMPHTRWLYINVADIQFVSFSMYMAHLILENVYFLFSYSWRRQFLHRNKKKHFLLLNPALKL